MLPNTHLIEGTVSELKNGTVLMVFRTQVPHTREMRLWTCCQWFRPESEQRTHSTGRMSVQISVNGQGPHLEPGPAHESPQSQQQGAHDADGARRRVPGSLPAFFRSWHSRGGCAGHLLLAFNNHRGAGAYRGLKNCRGCRSRLHLAMSIGNAMYTLVLRCWRAWSHSPLHFKGPCLS